MLCTSLAKHPCTFHCCCTSCKYIVHQDYSTTNTGTADLKCPTNIFLSFARSAGLWRCASVAFQQPIIRGDPQCTPESTRNDIRLVVSPFPPPCKMEWNGSNTMPGFIGELMFYFPGQKITQSAGKLRSPTMFHTQNCLLKPWIGLIFRQ